MTGMRATPPFRADHVGSLLRPAKLIALRGEVDAGKVPLEALRALEDECITEAIALQERAGLQSITDGEFRRSGWRDQFFESVEGFSTERFPSDFIFTHFSGERLRGGPVPKVAGALKQRKAMIADDFAWLKPRTRRTAKATIPAPSVAHFFRGDAMLAGGPYDGDRQRYFADVIRIYRDEIGHVAVGVRWFRHLCNERGLDETKTWRALVRQYCDGALKPPFNAPARSRAGLPEAFYLSD